MGGATRRVPPFEPAAARRDPTSGLPLYVFLHIPKTGGTTIVANLLRHWSFDREIVALGGVDELERTRGESPPLEERSEAELSAVRAIVGHRASWGVSELFGERPARYFTVMREPAHRIVSVYNFRASKPQNAPMPPFEEWYRTYPRNAAFKHLKRRLGLEIYPEIAARLRDFWFVGVTERLDDDLPHLFEELGVSPTWTNQRVAGSPVDAIGGIPGVQPVERRIHVTEDLRERINADHKRDARLHELALRRRRQAPWNRRPRDSGTRSVADGSST